MMDLEKISPLLNTSKPIDIFKKIIAHNRETEADSKKAKVRIGLSSGYILEGKPLKIDTDGNVVFTTANNGISYVNVKTLAGVELLNPEVLLEILTDGSYFELPSDGAPSNLQLKRVFKSRTDEIESRYGFEVHSELLENGLMTKAEKYQFEQFLSLLQDTLEDVAKDSLGKEALNELQEMSIDSDKNHISLAKTSGRLKVGINFKNKFSNDFKDQLKVAFESKL